MDKFVKKVIILATISLLSFISCSIGTSFRANEIKSFKGTLIPELI